MSEFASRQVKRGPSASSYPVSGNKGRSCEATCHGMSLLSFEKVKFFPLLVKKPQFFPLKNAVNNFIFNVSHLLYLIDSKPIFYWDNGLGSWILHLRSQLSNSASYHQQSRFLIITALGDRRSRAEDADHCRNWSTRKLPETPAGLTTPSSLERGPAQDGRTIRRQSDTKSEQCEQ